MLKHTVTHLVVIAISVVIIVAVAGCAGQSDPSQTNDSSGVPITAIDSGAVNSSHSVGVILGGYGREAKTLQEMVLVDLIIEGTVIHQETRVLDSQATEAELAEREARGELPPLSTDSEIAIDQVLKGEVPSATITVTEFGGTYKGTTIRDWEVPLLQLGDRVILFLRDISGDPVQALGQNKYMVVSLAGRFYVGEGGALFTHLPESRNPVADFYRGKDKSVLENDIRDLIAKLPPPSKEQMLQDVFSSSHLIVEGTIQDIHEVRLVPDEGRTQQWIDQMLAEGKMPGVVFTDYTVTVNKVMLDKFANQPRFFPDRKPLEAGQTIVVTRGGGTYQGVSQTREPGPPFEIGGREILFLVDLGIANGDPDYRSPGYQVRYGLIDSMLGRLLIGPNNTLTAFTTKGLGGIYGGQDIGQLEQDIAEFLKTHPFNQDIPVPPRP